MFGWVSLTEVLNRKQKRIRGGGGFWRAWIRWHSLGNKGTPSLHDMATDFKAAKTRADPLLQKLSLLASAATVAARAKPGKGSSCGSTTREDQRHRQKMLRLSLWHRAQSMTPQQRAEHVASTTVDCHGSLHEAVCAAKTLQLLDAKEHRTTKEEHIKLLHDFMEREGLHNTRWFKNALPNLPFKASDLLPVPTEHGLAFTQFRVTSATALASHYHGSNLDISLEHEWFQQHESLPPEQCPQLPQRRPKASRCRVEGLCVCQNPGKETWSMKNRFLKNIKQVFVSQTLQQKLSEGFLFAKFTTTALCPDHDAAVEHTLWLHLGWMMFSPYRSIVHVMTQTMESMAWMP